MASMLSRAGVTCFFLSHSTRVIVSTLVLCSGVPAQEGKTGPTPPPQALQTRRT
jgi:hypothetical protein